jgi:phospholipid/cholesterol/gamma-HCH transport system substrate-binding protein
MPDRSKVRWSQLKVGVIGLAASVIIFMLVFLLTSSKGTIFQHNATLYTYMDDASGIADGSIVRLNGYPIGYLDRLRLTGSRDPHRAVEFDMKIKPEFLPDIPLDSVAGISAANLLGDKFINITRGQDQRTVKDGDGVRSLQAQDIPELMAASANLLQSFQGIINRVDALLAGVEAGRGNIGLFLKDEELYNRLTGIETAAQRLLDEVHNGTGTISKLLHDDALYQEIRAPLKRIDTLLAGLEAGQGTAGRLMKDPALYDELQKTVAEIRSVVADVNAGKGTAGKLLKNDDLANRLDQLLAKLSGTVDRINSGQGSLGQLVVNPQLYESLNGMTREFQSLARDMHANPKKFLTIRLTLF